MWKVLWTLPATKASLQRLHLTTPSSCGPKPDCANTEFENGNRTWFYFGIKCVKDPESKNTVKVLKLTVMNLNKQSKLYSQGMMPNVLRVPVSASNARSKVGWERLKDIPSYHTEDNNFVLSFRVKIDPKCVTYVSFTYPYTYKELQSYLGRVDRKYGCADKSYEDLSESSSIYFHRENVCYSLQQRRIDLLTISGSNGMLNERESKLKNLFPSSRNGTVRPFKFANKKVVFLSARVHPGETQSSFVVTGFLKFILRPTDPRAVALRRKYVFKIMPMLNPDGVYNGHYRTDIRGVNLNRVYAKPDLDHHPSIYAARKLLLYAHLGQEPDENDDALFVEPALSRVRRDSTRSISDNVVVSESSGSSTASRWLRSSLANIDGASTSLLNSWYEMTETSRCSEGDESIADFSINNPSKSAKKLNIYDSFFIKHFSLHHSHLHHPASHLLELYHQQLKVSSSNVIIIRS